MLTHNRLAPSVFACYDVQTMRRLACTLLLVAATGLAACGSDNTAQSSATPTADDQPISYYNNGDGTVGVSSMVRPNLQAANVICEDMDLGPAEKYVINTRNRNFDTSTWPYSYTITCGKQ
jgi:hypothetical protein